MQRAYGGNGVGCRVRTPRRCSTPLAFGNAWATTGEGCSTNGAAAHPGKNRRPREAGVVVHAGSTQRPSSNTASMLIDRVFSPGATEVSLAKPASAAIARIIGTGRGMLAPPSLMLTIRRTFRPSASA